MCFQLRKGIELDGLRNRAWEFGRGVLANRQFERDVLGPLGKMGFFPSPFAVCQTKMRQTVERDACRPQKMDGKNSIWRAEEPCGTFATWAHGGSGHGDR